MPTATEYLAYEYVNLHNSFNGKATGPYDLATLKQMVIAGKIVGSTLVWKTGMSSWAAIETIDELKDVLANVIPPIPPTE